MAIVLGRAHEDSTMTKTVEVNMWKKLVRMDGKRYKSIAEARKVAEKHGHSIKVKHVGA